MAKSGPFILRDAPKKRDYLLCLSLTDPLAPSACGRPKAHFVAFRRCDQCSYGLSLIPVFDQTTEVVESINKACVKSLILLGRRTPQHERIEIKRYILVKEWDSKVEIDLWNVDAVEIS